MRIISRVPTYGAVLPEATVETRILGTPNGSARIAAEATVEPPRKDCRALRHDGHGLPAILLLTQRIEGAAARARNFVGGNIRRKLRFAYHASIYHEHRMPARVNQVADKCKFHTFGI